MESSSTNKSNQVHDEKFENPTPSSSNVPTSNKLPKIEIEIGHEVSNESSRTSSPNRSALSGQNPDSSGQTPKHCNKTSVGKNENLGKSKPSLDESDDFNKKSKGKSAKTKVKKFSPRRTKNKRNTGSDNERILKHPGYPNQSYPPHDYKSGPSSSYAHSIGARNYSGQEPGPSEQTHGRGHMNGPGPAPFIQREKITHGPRYHSGHPVDHRGYSNVGGGAGYYNHGQDTRTLRTPHHSHPSTVSPGSNNYGYNSNSQGRHDAHNESQYLAQRGPRGQPHASSYPNTHNDRLGPYHHGPTSTSRDTAMGSGTHHPPSSSHYSHEERPHMSDYTGHRTSNQYSPHGLPPHSGPAEQHSSHFGREVNRYASTNANENGYQAPSHRPSNNGYSSRPDNDRSYDMRGSEPPPSSYPGQQQHHSDAHTRRAPLHTYDGANPHPNGVEHPPSHSANGDRASLRRPVHENGIGDHKSHNTSSLHQTSHGEPQGYYTQDHKAQPSSYLQTQNHHHESNVDENLYSSHSSIGTTPKTSHHKNNLARTVSSSFEGTGGAGHSNNMHSYKSYKMQRHPHDQENLRSTNTSLAKALTTRTELSPSDRKFLSTSNPAFAKDVATHCGQYANNHSNFDGEGQNYNHRKSSTNSPGQGSDSSWHQLNKVAGVDHNDLDRRNGREFGDHIEGDGIELPLTLQTNPSNLDSLASLSSVASIQEQLPLESSDSKEEETTPTLPEQVGDVSREGRTLTYESDTLNVFDKRNKNDKKSDSTKNSKFKESSAGNKRNREPSEESREPLENSNDTSGRSNNEVDKRLGQPSPEKTSTEERSSPARKKRLSSNHHVTGETSIGHDEKDLSTKYKSSPLNLLPSGSPNSLGIAMDNKFEVPKFSSKKELKHCEDGNSGQLLNNGKVQQPTPKYASNNSRNASNGPLQAIRQAPRSKDGNRPTMQSDNSCFIPTDKQAKRPGQSFDEMTPKYAYSHDSRDGSNKGFVPLLNPRPGSASSGSITVMNPMGHERSQSSSGGFGLGSIAMMPSMHSWDIQNQDSFTSTAHTEASGGSNGDRGVFSTTESVGNKSSNNGAGLPPLSSFSFTNDTNMLEGNSGHSRQHSSSALPNNNLGEMGVRNKAELHRPAGPSPYLHGPPPPPHRHDEQHQQESRNQSFDFYNRPHGSGSQRNTNPLQRTSDPHNFGYNRRNLPNDDHFNRRQTLNHHPYNGPPPHEHNRFHTNYDRGGGQEERTSVGGSFGGPTPSMSGSFGGPGSRMGGSFDGPVPRMGGSFGGPSPNMTGSFGAPGPSHRVSNGPPSRGPPSRHYPQGPNGPNASHSWVGPPSHHYPHHHPNSHMPHGPVHSHSFGSVGSSHHHYPYGHRPGSPHRYNQQQEFQPPQREYMPHNKPPPTVFIVSNPNRNLHNDPSMGASSAMKGVYSWSKDDDNRLTEVMKKYRNPKEWDPIAREHGRGKSAKECHERWIRYLKPGVRKGQWQDHEDAIVVEAVTTSSEQPFTRWSDLAQRLPGRVGKQIRDRWVNHLNPAINHMPFTREDDLLLFKGHEDLGKRWVEISTKYFNSTRSENHIKNRWYSASFRKFIANEFGPDAYSGAKKSKDKTDEPTINKEEGKKEKSENEISSENTTQKIEVKGE